MSTLTGDWKKFIAILMGDFEGIQVFSRENNCRCNKNSKRTRSGA